MRNVCDAAQNLIDAYGRNAVGKGLLLAMKATMAGDLQTEARWIDVVLLTMEMQGRTRLERRAPRSEG
jgi:hypothetical protein